MHPDHFDDVMRTGKLPAPGEQRLQDIGVRDGSVLTREAHPEMPRVEKGWASDHAYGKGEGPHLINVGLGHGTALDVSDNSLTGAQAVS